MGLFEWLDDTVKKMRWYDVSLVKMAVLFSTLFLLTAWPALSDLALSVAWPWYLGLAVLAMLPLLVKMFSKH